MRVTILVLGDLGNSPRMQYHALALATNLADVDLVGYAGSPLRPRVGAHPDIHLRSLPPPSRLGPDAPRLLFVVLVAWRVVIQCVRLLWLLMKTERSHVVLVQNPPAVPTLLVALVVARLRSASLVIDWHNFGYAMLALRLGTAHPLVRAARWYERVVGRLADAHFCVSRAMQAELAQHWGIRATVLYDRPLEASGPTPMAVRRDLFERLGDVGGRSHAPYRPDAADRPALIVSPTSWTADEDFSILLDALERWDALLDEPERPRRQCPDLLVLATGRGPLRAAFEARAEAIRWRRTRLRTLWLPPEDYPLLLGAADLGLCLHRSASGVDLPMKVMDMFGAGLPVCAFDYGPCLAEQVSHGENGLLFSSAPELAEQLCDLFRGFPDDTPRLDRLRHNLETQRTAGWSEEWTTTAQPIFAQAG